MDGASLKDIEEMSLKNGDGFTTNPHTDAYSWRERLVRFCQRGARNCRGQTDLFLKYLPMIFSEMEDQHVRLLHGAERFMSGSQWTNTKGEFRGPRH